MSLNFEGRPVASTTANLEAAIAVTRFGLGARPGEMARASADPRGFLKAQIRRSGADQPQGDLKPSLEILQRLGEVKGMKASAPEGQTAEDRKAAK
jgi:uncharacterized protein (DUF1800 family)